MSGSLEINVSTADFARLQATLESMNPVKLDLLMRAVVNGVATWAGGQINKHISSDLGLPESVLQGRMRRTLSDSRQHAFRSSWLWYGGNQLTGSHLIHKMGLEPVFTPGQVQVGKFIWRRGFIWPGSSKGALMQRETDSRYPITTPKAAIDEAIESAIVSVSPKIPAKLEEGLERRISSLIGK